MEVLVVTRRNWGMREALAERGSMWSNHLPACPICYSDARCLLGKIFIKQKSYSPFPHPQQISVFTFFCLHYWISAQTLRALAVKERQVFNFYIVKQSECHFRRSFMRWILPAQSRSRLWKSQHREKPKQLLLLWSGDLEVHWFKSIMKRPFSSPCSVEEGSFDSLAM